ncbi:hypothetical protein AMELA_G00069000 [Ameiurus melas]|uniref:Uncharacterized protein n=1 Tax=Ameiurus melas TaxID=219545 RepID=A0A7J6B3Z7_AMEME|nr:hypothetical protein AMELA_G00069000 [Ameiurus melas]
MHSQRNVKGSKSPQLGVFLRDMFSSDTRALARERDRISVHNVGRVLLNKAVCKHTFAFTQERIRIHAPNVRRVLVKGVVLNDTNVFTHERSRFCAPNVGTVSFL